MEELSNWVNTRNIGGINEQPIDITRKRQKGENVCRLARGLSLLFNRDNPVQLPRADGRLFFLQNTRSAVNSYRWLIVRYCAISHGDGMKRRLMENDTENSTRGRTGNRIFLILKRIKKETCVCKCMCV